MGSAGAGVSEAVLRSGEFDVWNNRGEYEDVLAAEATVLERKYDELVGELVRKRTVRVSSPASCRAISGLGLIL